MGDAVTGPEGHMTRFLAALLIAGLAAPGAVLAQATCGPRASNDAGVVPLQPSGPDGKANAQLLIGATLLLEIAKVDAEKVRMAAEPCDLGVLKIEGADWRLTTGDKLFIRRAIGPDAASPVATIYPFVDLLQALNAQRAHTAPPPARFMLLTVQGSVDTIWRAYDAPPSNQQFADDLTTALTHRTAPSATVDVATKKVNLIVSGNAH